MQMRNNYPQKFKICDNACKCIRKRSKISNFHKQHFLAKSFATWESDITYHFIGLGGIGMSALARILLQKGCAVQGTDAASSLLLEELGKEGASVQVGHSIDALKDAQTVVYSSGIKEDNVELVDAKQRNLRV